jgi:hypothetical protein
MCVSEDPHVMGLRNKKFAHTWDKKFGKPHGQSISPRSVHERRERIATKDQTAPSLLLPINKTKNKKRKKYKRKSKKKRKERQGSLPR